MTPHLGGCPPGFAVETWARCSECRAPVNADGDRCTGVERHPRPAQSVRMYATWTGTRENLAAMHEAGIRLIVGPSQMERSGTPPLSWALDNGAWGCFNAGLPFDDGAFRLALARFGPGADWIALPDIVAGGRESLSMSLAWLPEVAELGRLMLLPVQNGMSSEDVRPHLGERVGIFVGGDDAFKEATAAAWGALARDVGCYLHIGRVNTRRRIQIAIDAGADSIDGTSPSRFSVNSPKIGNWCGADPMPALPFGDKEEA